MSMVNYDEFAQRHNAAYAAFRSIYESKNPSPEKPRLSRDIVSNVIILALVVVAVASVIVSGTRTVAEFGQYGLVAFTMVEGGMVAYSFFRAKRGGGSERLENSRKFALAGLVLAFLTAIFANIDNVLTVDGIVLPQAVDTTIALLVALSAPVMTFISADVLALELMAGDARRRAALSVYEQSQRDWIDGLNKAWSSQQSRWGVKVSVERPPQLSEAVQMDNVDTGQRTASGQGYNRTSDAKEKAIAYFEANPDAVQLSVRELADVIGVSKSTVANAKREFNGR